MRAKGESFWNERAHVVSDSGNRILAILRDIYEVSRGCSTRTYIWGGLVPDIAQGHLLREHHDIDGFTIGLLEKRRALSKQYQNRGYSVTFLDDFHMMRIEREGIHAAFNRLDIEQETAMWRHIGDNGTVYFPKRWLPEEPCEIHGVKTCISGMQFEYCIKREPSLLSPVWKRREKDAEALDWLKQALEKQGIDTDGVFGDIWSVNPFWAEKGYTEYERPFHIEPLRQPYNRSLESTAGRPTGE